MITRWLSSFESPQDVCIWLAHYGVAVNTRLIKDIWQARYWRQYKIAEGKSAHEVDYKLTVKVGIPNSKVVVKRKVITLEKANQ